MKIDLYNKKIVVFGYNYSGKTYLVKKLTKTFKGKVLVYDWHKEYTDVNKKDLLIYYPKFKTDVEKRLLEFNTIINKLFVNKKGMKLLIVDEANEYLPSRKPLPSSIEDLRSNHAHYNQSYILIARRPVDLNTNLIEVADYRIFFRLDGKNDLQYVDSLKKGLSDIVANLKEHYFAVFDYKGNVTVCKPV